MFPSAVRFARLPLQQRVEMSATLGGAAGSQPQQTLPGAGTRALPTLPGEEVVTTTITPQPRRDEGTQGPSDLGIVTPNSAQGAFDRRPVLAIFLFFFWQHFGDRQSCTFHYNGLAMARRLGVTSLPILDKKIDNMQRGSIRQQHCQVEKGLPRFL